MYFSLPFFCFWTRVQFSTQTQILFGKFFAFRGYFVLKIVYICLVFSVFILIKRPENKYGWSLTT